jgi:hypothetical protein
MVDQLEQISPDLSEAFGQAVTALIAWEDGGEPSVLVHGRPTLISAIASLVGTYKDTIPQNCIGP